MKSYIKYHKQSSLVAGLLMSCLTVFSQPGNQARITGLLNKEYDGLVDLYRHLHTNPELSLQEKETAARMAKELVAAGFEVTTSVGGYGVVGVLRNGQGKTILVRTDMDALPIAEQTNVPYASRVQAKDEKGNPVPVMHACGHDMHMAVWTGVARIVSQLKSTWKGTLVFIAQPAEETGVGALHMIEDGLFTKFPEPDYALALHVNSAVEAGKIGFCPGYSLANIDNLDITVKGKGGHGASPYTTIDPIMIASKLVLAFQDIVGREVPAVEPAVISVGTIHGGTSSNSIPDRVQIQVTVRSLNPDIQRKLIESIKRTCEGIAHSCGAKPEDYPVVEIIKPGLPAVFNDITLSEKLSAYLKTVLGNENVLLLGPEMFGEDFSRYGSTKANIPSVLYSVGAVSKEDMKAEAEGKIKLPSTHSPLFIPDTEPALRTGVISMSSAILYLLNEDRKKH
ncbi:MAG: amidohydrolase [Terrimonas sp.]|nr:amidohydrolase [Terrimonas sp.]